MRRYLLFVFFLVLNISCGKNKVEPGKEVEMYLLTSYQLVAGQCAVDSASYILNSAPLISNDEILQYNRASHQYRLSNPAIEKIKKLSARTAFAITVDKKVIYFGFYMPAFLSSTCFNSITMDNSWDQSNSISMKLGYPGTLAGINIDDQRNNPKILATFAKLGKLQ